MLLYSLRRTIAETPTKLRPKKFSSTSPRWTSFSSNERRPTVLQLSMDEYSVQASW